LLARLKKIANDVKRRWQEKRLKRLRPDGMRAKERRGALLLPTNFIEKIVNKIIPEIDCKIAH
jgi:hypothetical protein